MIREDLFSYGKREGLRYMGKETEEILVRLKVFYDLLGHPAVWLRKYYGFGPYLFFKYLYSPFMSPRIRKKFVEGSRMMINSYFPPERHLGELVNEIVKRKIVITKSYLETLEERKKG